MKIEKKKAATAAPVVGLPVAFVSIGNRGVSCPQFTVAPDRLTLNDYNDLPEKVRQGSDVPMMPLWRSSHSWVQSRKPVNGVVPQFFFGTLEYAVKKGLVKVFTGIEIERKLAGYEDKQPKKSRGTLVMPASWTFGQKMPFVCGFVADKGAPKWIGGRIEATPIAEKPEPRNLIFVAKVNWPEEILAKMNAKAKPAKDESEEETDEKPAAKPAKGKAAPAAPAPKAPAPKAKAKPVLK